MFDVIGGAMQRQDDSVSNQRDRELDATGTLDSPNPGNSITMAPMRGETPA